jgi:hypothetical protein
VATLQRQEDEAWQGRDYESAAKSRAERLQLEPQLPSPSSDAPRVNVEDVAAADSVKDVVLFERMSEEPLPLEPAGNVKELVALFESTLLMSFNLSCITCSLLSTRASDVL